MAGVEREGGLSKEALKLQPCADCLSDKPARAAVGRKCVCMRGEPFARARAGMSEEGVVHRVTNFVLESTERPLAGPRAVGSCAVGACGSSAHPNGSSSASKNSASSEESAGSADGWADARGTCSAPRLHLPQAVTAANPAVHFSAVVPVMVQYWVALRCAADARPTAAARRPWRVRALG